MIGLEHETLVAIAKSWAACGGSVILPGRREKERDYPLAPIGPGAGEPRQR